MDPEHHVYFRKTGRHKLINCLPDLVLIVNQNIKKFYTKYYFSYVNDVGPELHSEEVPHLSQIRGKSK